MLKQLREIFGTVQRKINTRARIIEHSKTALHLCDSVACKSVVVLLSKIRTRWLYTRVSSISVLLTTYSMPRVVKAIYISLSSSKFSVIEARVIDRELQLLA